MDWKAALAEIRAALPPGAGGVQRGSLRWLEAELRARGGNPAALRNIVYRDVGTAADKRLLAGLLGELAQEAGLSLDLLTPAQEPAPLPPELELLGRSKKRVYKQFLAGVRAGRSPRLVVAGRAGAGKTVLLDHLAAALQQAGVPVERLNLSGDLLALAGGAGLRDRSFASLAARQLDVVRALLPPDRLPVGSALLVRVTENLHFGNDPPRLPGGVPTTAAAWAAEVLRRHIPPGVSVLFALEDTAGWPPDAGEITELQPPTLTEARAYLMSRLGVPRPVADSLARETGRNLDRLALLAGAGGNAARLLSDPDVRRLACAAAALLPPPAGARDAVAPPGNAPVLAARALALALGGEVTALPLHARSLLEAVTGPAGESASGEGASGEGASGQSSTGQGEAGEGVLGWRPRPLLWLALPLLPEAEVQAATRRFAEATRGDLAPEVVPYRLAALVALGEWSLLERHVRARPDDARHLPALWRRIRAGATSPEREGLARAVVTHHASRGEYHAPAARDALFVLLEAEGAAHAWARVKLAESSLDAGEFGTAQTQLEKAQLGELTGGRTDDWSLAAQSDGLLVQAALARWRGDIEEATRAVNDPRTAQSGPRARLWRGLVAKDAGRWAEALDHLGAVPDSSPLLSARARYQEGDLRLRLGQPAAAYAALSDAARRLKVAGANPEERARVLGRAATAQRRLGHAANALRLFGQALELLPADRPRSVDAVLRARLLSEQVPVLLALGRPDEALTQAAQALTLLRGEGGRRAEVTYRVRRTQYRVALAYLTRGRGVPYLQPFGGPEHDAPDLMYARTLLGDLLQVPAGQSDREQLLVFDMHLARALAQPDPRQALEDLGRALDMTDHPYAEAQVRALRAEAFVRAGDPAPALGELGRAHALLRRVRLGLPGAQEADPALSAQLLAVEVQVQLAEAPRQAGETLLGLRQALTDPALRPFHAGIWREAGRALERLHPTPQDVLDALFPGSGPLPLRVSDALVVLAAPDDPTAPEGE